MIDMHNPVERFRKERGYEAVDGVSYGDDDPRLLYPCGAIQQRGSFGAEIVLPTPGDELRLRCHYWTRRFQLAEQTFAKLKAAVSQPGAPPFTMNDWPREFGPGPSGDALADLKFLKESFQFCSRRARMYSAAMDIEKEKSRGVAPVDVQREVVEQENARRLRISQAAQSINLDQEN